MKHKVSELQGTLLDAAVAKAEGHNFRVYSEADSPIGREVCVAWPEHHAEPRNPLHHEEYEPSTDWAAGGPIIERERIATWPAGSGWCAAHPTGYREGRGSGYFDAEIGTIDCRDDEIGGPTALIAAMRAFVAARLGDEVELP